MTTMAWVGALDGIAAALDEQERLLAADVLGDGQLGRLGQVRAAVPAIPAIPAAPGGTMPASLAERARDLQERADELAGRVADRQVAIRREMDAAAAAPVRAPRTPAYLDARA
jgi:hypothetical protein